MFNEELAKILDPIMECEAEDWQYLAALAKVTPAQLEATLELMPEDVRGELAGALDKYGRQIASRIKEWRGLLSDASMLPSQEFWREHIWNAPVAQPNRPHATIRASSLTAATAFLCDHLDLRGVQALHPRSGSLGDLREEYDSEFGPRVPLFLALANMEPKLNVNIASLVAQGHALTVKALDEVGGALQDVAHTIVTHGKEEANGLVQSKALFFNAYAKLFCDVVARAREETRREASLGTTSSGEFSLLRDQALLDGLEKFPDGCSYDVVGDLDEVPRSIPEPGLDHIAIEFLQRHGLGQLAEELGEAIAARKASGEPRLSAVLQQVAQMAEAEEENSDRHIDDPKKAQIRSLVRRGKLRLYLCAERLAAPHMAVIGGMVYIQQRHEHAKESARVAFGRPHQGLLEFVRAYLSDLKKLSSTVRVAYDG